MKRLTRELHSKMVLDVFFFVNLMLELKMNPTSSTKTVVHSKH